MSIGKMVDRLAFDAPREEPDGSGGVIQGWQEQFVCWGHLRYLRGGETVQAARLRGRQPVVVTTRASAAALLIKSDWRMRHVRRGTIYNVRTEPVPTENRLYLEITAESGVEV